MTAQPRVAVLDYGSGNLRSAERALARAGAQVTVTSDFDFCLAADGLVVPGVGAFAACMAGINQVQGGRLIDLRLSGGRPVLGICVGMQVLFDAGEEHGVMTEGLGQWPGSVQQLAASVLPHMGWNTVQPPVNSWLFNGVENERFYFVHSYAVTQWNFPDSATSIAPPQVTWSEHGEKFVAAVENGSLAATQFHPEKSSDAGIALLRNWIERLKS